LCLRREGEVFGQGKEKERYPMMKEVIIKGTTLEFAKVSTERSLGVEMLQ